MYNGKMKVLSMAWSIYDAKIDKFKNNCTGGGLVIRNICEYIGKEVESYLFIGSCHLSEQKIGNIQIVGTENKLNENDNDLVKDEEYLKNMTQKFALAIDKIKPDIVNFHGIGVLMQYCIQICKDKRVPYVYTEHLYIGVNNFIEGYDTSIKWEKMVYNIPQLPIIAVSHGMKKKILQDFPKIPESNIEVILNGTDFIAENIENNYKEKYQLYKKKVLLCVGTILVRKNQMQIINSYLKLPTDIRDNLVVIFCGRDNMQGRLQEQIRVKGLENKLIYAGAVSSEDMKTYYSIADGLIMPSLAEGLSIAALEAIAYGLPVIMFQDSECAEDLNDNNVVSFACGRDDQTLADAISLWYQKQWNKDYIVEYAKQFTMERMATNYINYYKMRINKR